MTDKRTPAPITIAIVDDTADVRRSVETFLRHQPDMCCVGSFETAEKALLAIPELKPQLVLMDINLPGMSGIECVRLLSKQMPVLQIVMLTVYEDDDDIFNSLAAGATGYLLKPVRMETLIEAIREVHSGGAPMSMKIARRVVQTFKQPAGKESALTELSAREFAILELLAKGFQTKEIGTQLDISYWTVVRHVSHIYEKLHVRSRTEAVAKYLGT
jgi:DNA-binding NarL/FixJ family response regulator